MSPRDRPTPKRGQREGSVRRMPRKGDEPGKPTGKWRGELMVGFKLVPDPKNPDITRRVKDIRYVYGTTKQQALDQIAALRGEQIAGTLVEPSRWTLGEYLGFWLQNVVRPKRGAKTFISYEQNMRNHVVPALGHLRITDLRNEHIVQLYGDLYQDGRVEQNRGVPKSVAPGLASETLRGIHVALHSALEHATAVMRLLPRNPADGASPARPGQREMCCLTREEAQRFLAAADTPGGRWGGPNGGAGGGRLQALWHVLLDTGMRLGEALALRWADFDEARGTLTIRRALAHKRGLNGEPVFGVPKTPHSRRTVTLSAGCVDVLRRHRQLQAQDRERFPEQWKANGRMDLLFATRHGDAIGDSNLRWTFKRLAARAGMPSELRIHDLRHTNATLLLADGEYVKVVSRRLGHKDITITLQRYGHILPDHEAQAAARVDRLLYTPANVPNATQERVQEQTPERAENGASGRQIPTRSYFGPADAPANGSRNGTLNLVREAVATP